MRDLRKAWVYTRVVSPKLPEADIKEWKRIEAAVDFEALENIQMRSQA